MNARELGAKASGDHYEFANVEGTQATGLNLTGNLIVDCFDRPREELGLFGAGSEDALFSFLESSAPKLMDPRAMLGVPGAEGGHGNCEVLGYFVKRPAVGAEFDEFVFGFVVVHMVLVFFVNFRFQIVDLLDLA